MARTDESSCGRAMVLSLPCMRVRSLAVCESWQAPQTTTCGAGSMGERGAPCPRWQALQLAGTRLESRCGSSAEVGSPAATAISARTELSVVRDK